MRPESNPSVAWLPLYLLAVLAAWGSTGVPEDVNGDGVVNVLDLLEVLAAWGPCA